MTKVREIYMATLAGTSMLTRTVYVYLPADFSESGYDPDSDCWFGHSAVSLDHARQLAEQAKRDHAVKGEGE